MSNRDTQCIPITIGKREISSGTMAEARFVSRSVSVGSKGVIENELHSGVSQDKIQFLEQYTCASREVRYL